MEIEFKSPIPREWAAKIREVHSFVKQLATEFPIVELSLFGSVARGDFTMLSDLDFLVVSTDASQCRAISLAIEQEDLRDDVGWPKVDIIVRSKDYLESDYSDDWFPSNVREDKIILWEGRDRGV